MSSSTSSSSHELKVLVVVLVALAAVELTLRVVGPRISRDQQQTREILRIAQTLHRGTGRRVLFLGNSLTGCGVNAEVFQSELRNYGVERVCCAKVMADSSGLCEWYYYLKNRFVEPRLSPELVVIGFEEQDLTDRGRGSLELRRLGSKVCTVADISEVFKHDLPDFESRTEFLIAGCCYSLSQQDAVRHRILNQLIPHYEDKTQQLHRVRRQHDFRSGQPATRESETRYGLLQRLMTMLRDSSIECVFVAMPNNRAYGLPSGLEARISEAEMTLLDCREIGLTESHYADGYHLNERGAEILTRELARLLEPSLRRLAEKP